MYKNEAYGLRARTKYLQFSFYDLLVIFYFAHNLIPAFGYFVPSIVYLGTVLFLFLMSITFRHKDIRSIFPIMLLSLIEMVIIGCTQDEYEEKFGKIGGGLINRQVFFKGRIERGEVLRYLEKADFTMLMRPPEERYAKAGFPTKVVESLAAGIPIICNYSSDLSLYLSDCQNAVIVEDYSVLSCSKALKKAIELLPEKRAQMRLAARETAEKYFDYTMYIDCIKEFIENLE